jgi:hypothetical protein
MGVEMSPYNLYLCVRCPFCNVSHHCHSRLLLPRHAASDIVLQVQNEQLELGNVVCHALAHMFALLSIDFTARISSRSDVALIVKLNCITAHCLDSPVAILVAETESSTDISAYAPMSARKASGADVDMEAQMTGLDSLAVPLTSSDVSEYDDDAEPDDSQVAEATRKREEAQAKYQQEQEVKRKQDAAEAKREQEEAEARRELEDAEAMRKQAAEAKRNQEAEAKRRQEEAETRRKEAESKRELEEAETKRKAEEIRIAACDATTQLQRALSSSLLSSSPSSSVALLVAALSAADSAVASHPSLGVAHPQVAALRTTAHTRAAATAEDAIKAALALGGNNRCISGPNLVNGINTVSLASLETAIASAESVPSLLDHHQPAIESLRAAVANARRVAVYWSLLLRQADHTQWTCDEVVAAFAAVAHTNGLPADTIDAVIAYFKAELPNGSYLAVVGTDDSFIAPVVTNKMRRVRVTEVINMLCSSPKADKHAGRVAATVSVNAESTSQDLSASTASAQVSLISSPASNPSDAMVDYSVESDDENGDQFVSEPSMPPSSSLSSSFSSDPSSDIKNLASRLVDIDDSAFDAGQSALSGIFQADVLSFADAVKRCGVKGVAVNAMCAAKHGAKMKNHGAGGALTADHIAAIHMYTQASDFYKSLNLRLRDRDREQAKPFFPYLRLLLEGLRQLPAQKRSVFRGVKLDLSAKCRKGDEPVWWSLTSTSTSMDVLQSKEFCGQDGSRTVFMVQAAHARNIAAFSAFASEEEWILLPGAQLRVKAVVAMGGGLHLVQMDEVGPPLSLVEFDDE